MFNFIFNFEILKQMLFEFLISLLFFKNKYQNNSIKIKIQR